jgi:hypothetical protein
MFSGTLIETAIGGRRPFSDSGSEMNILAQSPSLPAEGSLLARIKDWVIELVRRWVMSVLGGEDSRSLMILTLVCLGMVVLFGIFMIIERHYVRRRLGQTLYNQNIDAVQKKRQVDERRRGQGGAG